MLFQEIYHFIIKFLVFFVPLLVSIAFLTLLERKIIASMQQRKGPNVVGIIGLLQPVADGVKLVFKETIIPSLALSSLFLIAPLLTFFCAIIVWYSIPFTVIHSFIDLNLNILYIFLISSLNVYSIIFAGWSSNSKYAILGALRSSAQMISYEVSLGLIILSVILFAQSGSLTDIVYAQQNIWFIIPLFPTFLLFFISSLAETNRTPFDLPEAEGELVAGYNVEYSGLTFALFFLGEYSNIIFMALLNALIFLGGWLPPFELSDIFYIKKSAEWFFINSKTMLLIRRSEILFIFITFIQSLILAIKTFIFIFIFIWVRATYPRYRYNQLMSLGWKIFLPVALGILLFNINIYILFFV